MPDASYLQTSFLGGEWSPLVQGRMDDKNYRTGMNLCRNTLPIEEGSAARRSGTHLVGPTRGGRAGVLRAFDFAESHPYNLELTEGHLRFVAGLGIVVESFATRIITALNTANPVQIATDQVHTWTTGDEVVVQIGTGELNATLAALLGRQLTITVIDTTHFTVSDAVTGATIDGTSMVLGDTDLTVTRIADFTTPYAEADLQAINTVQDQSDLILLHPAYVPQAIQSTTPEEGLDFAVFSIGPAVFKDGPYLDPDTTGTTIASSGLSGSVTLTLAGGTTLFDPSDVGRLVRLFSEPAAWSSATSYAIGAQVKFNDNYYQAIKANSAKQPDADVVNWGVATGAAAWTWAQITAYLTTTTATATIMGDPILRTTACATWRMGLFSARTGYPSCGTYHEGRLWLSGVIGNRIDGSKGNDFFNFEPTSPDGTVADDNACAYVFNAKDVNQIYWMEPDTLGIICGTQAGEWLVQASATNDNLTPTSVQAHRRTTYGAANIPARRTGLTITYVQRFNKTLLEYITTDFRGLSAHNLSLTGKHLTQKGLVEIAYQQEKVSTIWARTEDDSLISCTYERDSPYASDPPSMCGWAHHDLGNGLTCESIQTGPNFDGTIDALSMIVNRGGKRFVNVMTDLFDVDWTIGDANYVDFGETPSMWEVIAGTPTILRLYSLHYLAGENVDVFAGGVDAGTLTVAADGHLDIPIDVAGSLLTSAWLGTLSSATNFHGLGLAIVRTAPGKANTPTVTGVQSFDLSPISHYNGGYDVDFDGRRLFVADAFDGKMAVYSLDNYKLLAGPWVTSHTANGLTYAEDGYVYGWSGGPGPNNATLFRLSPTSGAVLAQFGLGGGPFGFSSSASTYAFPASVDTFKVNGRTFLVSFSLDASQTNNEVCVLDLGSNALVPIRFAGSANASEAHGVVCRGKPIHGAGVAHVMAWGEQQSNIGSTQIGFYTVALMGGVMSMRRVASVTPASLGTGWTHIVRLGGLCLDETDGNIIAHVGTQQAQAWSAVDTYPIGEIRRSSGHDFRSLQAGNINHLPTLGGDAFWTDLGVTFPTGTDENRIVKINVHTGAVIWSIVVTNTIFGVNINSTRIRHSKYIYLDMTSPHSNVRTIDTTDGTFVSSANLGVLCSTPISDDTTGNIYFDCQYAHTTPPVPIGVTPNNFTSIATLGPAAGPASPASLPPSDGVIWQTPVAIGYGYASQGQILRPINPQEAGAANGPALGKTRRSHMFSALTFKAQGVNFGTDFNHMRPALFRESDTERQLPLTTLYSDVHWDTLDDSYSFNSMLCWSITRPYPATICSLGAFLHTQDR